MIDLPVRATMLRALVIVLVALAIPGSIASAATRPPKHLAPPGNPAVTEYLEDIPNDMGSTPPRSGGKPSRTLSPGQRRHLDHLGSGGKLLVDVVNETAPPAVEPRAVTPPQVRSPGAGRPLRLPASPSRAESFGPARDVEAQMAGRAGSPVAAVLGAAIGQGGGGGVGLLLPGLMAAVLLLAILTAVRRRGSR